MHSLSTFLSILTALSRLRFLDNNGASEPLCPRSSLTQLRELEPYLTGTPQPALNDLTPQKDLNMLSDEPTSTEDAPGPRVIPKWYSIHRTARSSVCRHNKCTSFRNCLLNPECRAGGVDTVRKEERQVDDPAGILHVSKGISFSLYLERFVGRSGRSGWDLWFIDLRASAVGLVSCLGCNLYILGE